MTKEIIQAPQNFPVEALLQSAIDKNVPIETMERLLAMRRELKAEAAKEAFDRAMAAFQSECPVIEKLKPVKDNHERVLYSYAPLDSIVAQVKEKLGKHGLSYAIQTEMTATHVKVICIAKHEFGHSESSTVEMPLSTRTGIMSAPQQVAATITFGKRYAFCNAFGIMTGDEDTDGKEDKPTQTFKKKPPTAPSSLPPKAAATQEPPRIKEPHAPATEAQLKALAVVRQKYGMPEEAFKTAYKVQSTKELTKAQASAAIDALNKRIANGEQWEDPNLPKIGAEEPVGKVELPEIIEAEKVEKPIASPWDKWKKGADNIASG